MNATMVYTVYGVHGVYAANKAVAQAESPRKSTVAFVVVLCLFSRLCLFPPLTFTRFDGIRLK